MNYKLMHKDAVVAAISLNENRLDSLVIARQELMPYLGSADKEKLGLWLKNRSVPGTREDLQRILENAGCKSASEYLYKNLAVSINDCYWLCPADKDLSWADVNPYTNFHGATMEIHNDSSFDPSASLGGQMTKYVDMREEGPYIVKTDMEYHGLRCFNERTASLTHALQSWEQFVDYHVFRDPATHVVFCNSKSFTSEQVEFVPAIEVIQSQKQPNDMSNYDFFIQICENLGIAGAQRFMDYMTVTDFILSNQDRHLNNFGILRDSDTLQAISMAPIYDTGNSMFYKDMRMEPMDRADILSMPITSFHKTFDRMLTHVQDRSVVDATKLLSQDDVFAYYQKADISEARANIIAKNYETKVQLLHEFQHGKDISLYLEKRAKKRSKPIKIDFDR